MCVCMCFLGDYWIDPNEGDIKDAILVYCDIKKLMTCIRSQPIRSEILNILSEESEIWIGDHVPGFKVQYLHDLLKKLITCLQYMYLCINTMYKMMVILPRMLHTSFSADLLQGRW